MVDTPPPPRSPRSLPDTIGRYRITGRLGKGSMGIVYEARDEAVERRVAIKVMTGDLQDDPETSARFQREARAAGQLVHPNIITIFDMGTDDGRPYIVMELFEGETLGEYLKRAEKTLLEDKISLMMQVCEGLRLAHSKGIYHRDIKPGNLLVSNDGGLKIVDFGIARLAASSLTVHGLVVGTPDYMSPEQARGHDVDERSDIFSAGAVFYYMLTARKPFAARDLPAVLNKVQDEDPLPIRDTEAPPALAEVVFKALAKAPSNRYQTAAEMIAGLGRVSREIAFAASRMAGQVRSQVEGIDALESERARRCSELGAAPAASNVQQFREEIAEQYSRVCGWLDAGAGEPPRYAETQELLRQSTEMRSSLEAELTMLRQAAANLQRAATAERAGDLLEAIDHLDAVLKSLPASVSARNDAIRIRAVLAAKQAAADRARALTAEAQAAAERRDWPAVLTLTEQALAADCGSASAELLRARARKELDSQSRRRRRQCQRALERGEKLARKHRYAEAERAVRDAKDFDPSSPAAAALEERIRAARLDAERASEHERRSSEAAATARRTFDGGDRAGALAGLRDFIAREPPATGAAAALAALTVEADQATAAEARHAGAAELATAAAAALQRDEADEALKLAQEALRLHAAQPLARNIQAGATIRLRERLLATQHKNKVDQALASACALLARGRFDSARQYARKAATLNAADPEPRALLAAIDEAEATARQQERREREARQRAAESEPALEQARAAERASDFIRADWLAENVLAINPACVEARQIIERVQARLTAQPDLVDETVHENNDRRAVDPDETVTLVRAVSVWQRIAAAIMKWVARTRILIAQGAGDKRASLKQPSQPATTAGADVPDHREGA